MRNHDEFKDELLRRKSEFDRQRHRRIRLLTQGTCALVCLCLVLSFLLPGAISPDAPTEPIVGNVTLSTAPGNTDGIRPDATQTVNLLANFIPADTRGRPLDKVFTTAQMDFALKLLKGSYTGDNTLVSPLSAMLALSMTANGAGGDTLAQMEEVLCGGMDIADWNEYLKYYVNLLPSTEEAMLYTANSIWYDSNAGLNVQPAFLQAVTDYYDADIYATPFGPDALNEINGWISDNTDGLIDNALDELDDIMYLINALIFDGKWDRKYAADDLMNGSFHTESGEIQVSQLMCSTENWFLQSENAIGFMKDYAGGDYRFVAILPDEGMTLAQYLETLTPEGLTALLATAQKQEVYAGLPQFEYGSNISLVEVLSDMGITDLFNGALANLYPMATCRNDKLFVDQVIHRTYICVDPDGTKAAASTVVGVDKIMALPREVILDRPFLYMIVDTQTNLPIFLGTVTDLG